MIEHIFFESRLLLFAVWMVSQLGVIGLWSWRRTQATNRAVWLGLIALPLLMLVSTGIVTRGEEITAMCQGLARSVEQGEAARIGDALSDDFIAGDLDREAFTDRLNPALARFQITNLKLKRFEFVIEADDRATVDFSATCQVRTTDAYFDRVPSRWRLQLNRGDGTWLITSIDVVPTPLSPLRNLDDLLRR